MQKLKRWVKRVWDYFANRPNYASGGGVGDA
jgi:hypothetical protein